MDKKTDRPISRCSLQMFSNQIDKKATSESSEINKVFTSKGDVREFRN